MTERPLIQRGKEQLVDLSTAVEKLVAEVAGFPEAQRQEVIVAVL